MEIDSRGNDSRARTAAPATQFLTFHVAGEEYALAALRVREVIEVSPIVRVPEAPAAVRGLVHLRGSAVPVVDLGRRFGVGERPLTKASCIVVVELEVHGQKMPTGLLVDSVHEVVELDEASIGPVPTLGGGRGRAPFLRGVGMLRDRFFLVVDVDRVLRPTDLEATAALREETPPAAEEEPR